MFEWPVCLSGDKMESERRLPEDENKENEKREENCNIVHCTQHDY